MADEGGTKANGEQRRRSSTPNTPPPRHTTAVAASSSSSSASVLAPKGAPSSSSKQSSLAQDVNSLVAQIAANPKNTALFGQLIPKALDYIKSDDAGAKKTHILCSKGGRQPEWQFHACMIRVLSFKIGPEIQEWLDFLAKALYSCPDCFKGYLRAKKILQETYLAGFPEHAVERFLTHVDEWEENIALDLFERRKPAPNSGLGFLSTAELYAVLSAAAAREKILQRVKETLTLHKLTSTMPEIAAGVLRLAIEPDEKSRKWAAMQIDGRKSEALLMSEGIATTRPMQKVVKSLASQLSDASQPEERLDELWSAASLIYRCAPTALAPLAPAVLPNLQDTTTRLPHLLQAFDGILRSRGADLWGEANQKDSEYPLVLLSSILDNTTFFKEVTAMTNAAMMQPYVAWMSSLLATLSYTPSQDSPSTPQTPVANGTSSGTSTPRRQDTPPRVSSNLYAEVLKRLTHFLLERMQQGFVAAKQLAMDQGLTLLITEFEAVTDLQSPTMLTISQVVGLYARTITTLAFRGKLPGSTETLSSENALRQAAQTLVQLMLEADCTTIVHAVHTLASIHLSHLSRYKLRKKPGQKTAEEIYALAINESYPSPSICTELWSNSYQEFNAAVSTAELAVTASLFIKPLIHTILIGEPAIHTHLLPSPRVESRTYAPYKQAVKACIVAISRPIRGMRQQLPSMLNELAESDVSVGQSNLQELCVRLAADFTALNLSPVSEIHNAAQSVVRTAYTDAESRADVFKALLASTTGALAGVERALELFVQACKHLVEANEAAKWIVRSGADILEVLCGRTGGLLRSGAEHSYVDRQTQDLAVLQDSLPRIWELMCRSVTVIFEKTPKWAEQGVSKDDMVAWFRDVNLFSTQLTEQWSTVAKAVNAKRRKERRQGQLASEEEEEAADFIVSCLALPLEQAMSWLRINDIEIVNETIAFILKALDCFTGDVELPTRVREKMLKFVKEQIEIESAEERRTLLTITELIDLQSRLDPASAVIEVSDEEEADPSAASQASASSATPASQSWLASMGSPSKSGPSSSEVKKRKKMRQQKLNFSRADAIDVDALDSSPSGKPSSTTSKASSGMQAWPKAPPTQSAPVTSSNKYKSASTTASVSAKKSTAGLPKPTTAMQALRQQHAASRSFAHMRPPPQRVPNANDMRQPVAPAASSSVTGSDRTGKPAPAPTSANASGESDTSGSDASDEEDDDGAPKGLAALEQARHSPEKKRSTKMMNNGAKPVKRRTQLLDDGREVMERARKERAEAERKRLLRAATDLRNLHFSILEWNWYHQGDTYPPPRGGSLPPFQQVADKFRNADEYGAVFGPLLMLECWSQFTQAKEEYERGVITTFPCEVQGRVNVDSFVDVSVVMSNSTPMSFRLGESDVVIMRQREDGIAPDQRASRPRILIAKVEMFKRSPKGSQVTLRCVLEGDQQGISSHLVNRSVWDIGSLFPLSTVNREFGALLTLPHYDLVRDIMQAKVAPRYRASPQEVKEMVQTYGVNQPQAEAILGALQSQGFSLVQGPPGTGKTKTICALVAHFVATRRTPQNIGGAGGRAPAKQAITQKLLMCAPSNAAIDEVARRAKAGMRGPDGKDVKVKVVRIGRDEAMNVAVKDISLDNLVEEAMAKSAGQLGDGASVDSLTAEMRGIRHDIDSKQSELEQLRLNSGSDPVAIARIKHIEVETRALMARRLEVAQRLDEAKDKRQTGLRQMDADRRRIRNEILLDADVICSTLSGAGHEALASLPIDFETVIIDEAAQAVELSTIIPLRYGCKRCILVGDPKQLPPTVISPKASRLRYSQSLFKRMYDQSLQDVYLLSIQYRMHPNISAHPSAAFYGGALQDGPNMAQLTARPWHRDDLLAPFRFFSIRGQERTSRGHSFINPEEAQAALALYDRLVRSTPDFDFDGKVGCVTGYRGQMLELKRVFQQRYGSEIDKRIDFNTVDGFQGQEKDVIIFSLVRTGGGKKGGRDGGGGLGFLEDERRINVAVTRAKSSLFILGNADGLRDASKRDGLWRTLVGEAEHRGALRAVHKGTFVQTAIGGGRTIDQGQQRKGGRARPAGWLAAEEAARGQGSGSATSSREGTASATGRNSSPPPSKKPRIEEGEVDANSKKAASSPPKGTPPAPPARPPLPPGLQTMRPGAANARPMSTAPTFAPVRPSGHGVTANGMPAGLQTRRPPTAGGSNGRPRPPGGGNGNAGGGGGGGGTRVVRAGNSNQQQPSRPPPPRPQPARPIPRPGQPQQAVNANGQGNGGPPRPRPPPGGGGAGGGPARTGSAPGQAAMDAMFVKKRKR